LLIHQISRWTVWRRIQAVHWRLEQRAARGVRRNQEEKEEGRQGGEESIQRVVRIGLVQVRGFERRVTGERIV
jgi:hypothetical protein